MTALKKSHIGSSRDPDSGALAVSKQQIDFRWILCANLNKFNKGVFQWRHGILLRIIENKFGR